MSARNATRLRFKATVNPRATRPLNDSDEVGFVPMECIGEDGFMDSSRTRVVADVRHGYTYFEDNDVTVAKITPCFENGKGSVMRHLAGGVGFGTTELIVLRPNEDVDSDYLYYLTQTDHFRKHGEASMLGAGGQKRVPDLFVEDYRIDWPNKAQQIDIAQNLNAELARIARLLSAKSALREMLVTFSATQFFTELHEAAKTGGGSDGNFLWLDSIPSSWQKCKVKHVTLHFDQGISPQCEARMPVDGEWGVLKVGCVNSGQFNPQESKALPAHIPPFPECAVAAGDLLISRANTRDLVGRSAVAETDHEHLLICDKIYRLKLDRDVCEPEFIRNFLWIPAVRFLIECRASGASPSMLNIDRRTISDLHIVVPPLDEQREILDRTKRNVASIQRLIEHVDIELNLLRELRSATITDAVLDRIDLTELQPAPQVEDAAA